MDGVRYRREVFWSYPDQVLVIRLQADRGGMLSFSVNLATPHKRAGTTIHTADRLAVGAQVQSGGIRFALPASGAVGRAGHHSCGAQPSTCSLSAR